MGQSDVSVGNDCCLSHYHHHSEKNQSISLSVKAHLGEQLLMMMMTHINTDGSAQSVHLLVSKSTNQGISWWRVIHLNSERQFECWRSIYSSTIKPAHGVGGWWPTKCTYTEQQIHSLFQYSTYCTSSVNYKNKNCEKTKPLNASDKTWLLFLHTWIVFQIQADLQCRANSAGAW